MNIRHYNKTKSITANLVKAVPYLHDVIIEESPERIFWYANKLRAPFPAGEKVIAKEAAWAYYYARNVLKAPFPEGEKAIASDGYYSRLYAKYINKNFQCGI